MEDVRLNQQKLAFSQCDCIEVDNLHVILIDLCRTKRLNQNEYTKETSMPFMLLRNSRYY